MTEKRKLSEVIGNIRTIEYIKRKEATITYLHISLNGENIGYYWIYEQDRMEDIIVFLGKNSNPRSVFPSAFMFPLKEYTVKNRIELDLKEQGYRIKEYPAEQSEEQQEKQAAQELKKVIGTLDIVENNISSTVHLHVRTQDKYLGYYEVYTDDETQSLKVVFQEGIKMLLWSLEQVPGEAEIGKRIAEDLAKRGYQLRETYTENQYMGLEE